MFNGNSRFKLLRRLGAGGMGVVYEALDQQRNLHVALKTLRRADADLLYRLKREFRSLRDLVHPNLIGLGELFEEDGEWFFTMELLDGDDLLGYLRRVTAAIAEPDSTLDERLAARGGAIHTASGSAPGAMILAAQGPAADGELASDGEIREVFGQIAEGLVAIHGAGKIHRDIKPSNIVVTRERRAVILDFGLVTEHLDDTVSWSGQVVGSVPYMAPEQAAGDKLGPAADWYSVGVMLYEVLAGRRPFDGPVGVVMAAKQYNEPRDPRAIEPRCPEDLAELCMRMLRIEPGHRPIGSEVLRQLGVPAVRASPPPPRRVFVGRDAEMRALCHALDDVDAGAAVTAVVYGESGIGKTTLLQHFVATVERRVPALVVLSGQCREHEAVPFRAMDGVIDALVRYVCSLPSVAAAELVPQNAALLPAVFPVLARIPAIANAPRPLHVARDPFQQRQRVFAALRELVCRLTERYRLILVIEDMQWVDSDSLHLLTELLRPPDPPRMLLLASVRTSDDARAAPELPGDVRHLRLTQLNPEESRALAGLLLDHLAPEQRAESARIVDETGGHPLFIGELVRFAAADRGARGALPLRLDEAIWARACQLSSEAMAVLQVLAIAVAPLPEDVIRAAAGPDTHHFQRTATLLRTGNLIRSAAPPHTALEVYHDRIRQAVLAHIPGDERIALHRRIAAALEASSEDTPPELLIHHLEGAAQFGEAARKAVAAADRAQAALAFEQAVQLYQVAQRLGGWSDAETRQLWIKLGGALASAGRGPDAADAYARAADGADPATQLACRIQRADQLVQSGLLEGGASLLFSLFREQGHRVPRSQTQIALRIVWYRARLALRGLRWTDRQTHELRPRDLALLTLYHAASRGLILVDPVRAAYFVIRGLHLALDAGDRDLIMYFLVLETGFRGGEGGRAHEAFLREADALMRDHAEPLFRAIYRLHKGSSAYLAIDRQFKEAFEILERCDEELAQTANAAWWLSASRFFLIYSLHKIGDFARLRSYAERFTREAKQRGNLYAKTTINRVCNILRLVDDDVAAARADLTADAWISYTRGYHSQHWMELYARIEIAIYEGSSIDPAYVAQHLGMLERSFLRRVLGYRIDTDWVIGRLALSELPRDPARRRTVRSSIARLRSYDTRFAEVVAAMLQGALAVHDHDLAGAAAAFRGAIAVGDATNLMFLPAVARRRLGALVGGDEGRAMFAASERWMRGAGIRNVERMTELASPCGRALALHPAATP